MINRLIDWCFPKLQHLFYQILIAHFLQLNHYLVVLVLYFLYQQNSQRSKVQFIVMTKFVGGTTSMQWF